MCVDEALYNRSVRSFIYRGNRYVAADPEKTRPVRRARAGPRALRRTALGSIEQPGMTIFDPG